ncbi:MAG: hypothetical protein GTN36_03745 [Candidatus Aenigmarchaeota archaeon]|nr:hypothetical protein [Candidatus Aenigmarchaeota archaeon]
MRGISAIMELLLVTLILIILATLFWFFTSGTIEAMSESGTERTKRTGEILSTCMIVDSVHKNNIYIKNCGDGVIVNDSLNVFLDDMPLEFNMTPESISKGEIGTVTVNTTNLLGLSIEDHDLKISNPSLQIVQKIEAVLHDSCVLAFDFDEGSGIKVHDSSDYENDGTIYGNGISWTDGKFGSALDFPGTDERYVAVSDSPSLDITDEITIEAWIYPEKIDDTGSPYIVSKNYDHPDEMTYAFLIHYSPVGQITGVLNEININGIKILSTNQWYHVAMSWNGNLAKIFVNGNKTGETTFAGPLTPNDYRLVVGARNDGGTPPTLNTYRQFNGTIDNLRIYNKALTPAETINFKMR